MHVDNRCVEMIVVVTLNLVRFVTAADWTSFSAFLGRLLCVTIPTSVVCIRICPHFHAMEHEYMFIYFMETLEI